MPLATLLILTPAGRAQLLARAERSLAASHVLVQVKDLVGQRRASRTTPASPNAELVASEPPLLLRGGLTVLVSYYALPCGELDASEEHSEDGEATHTHKVKLRVACRPRVSPGRITA